MLPHLGHSVGPGIDLYMYLHFRHLYIAIIIFQKDDPVNDFWIYLFLILYLK